MGLRAQWAEGREMWPRKRRQGGRLHLHGTQLQMGRLQKAGGQLGQRDLREATDCPPWEACGIWGQGWSPERISLWHRKRDERDAGRMRRKFRREEKEGRARAEKDKIEVAG